MKYFAYIVVGRTGYDGFDVPQTPQSFADDTEQRLTEPDFLEGYKRYALVVWIMWMMFHVTLLRSPTICSVAVPHRR